MSRAVYGTDGAGQDVEIRPASSTCYGISWEELDDTRRRHVRIQSGERVVTIGTRVKRIKALFAAADAEEMTARDIANSIGCWYGDTVTALNRMRYKGRAQVRKVDGEPMWRVT